MILYFLLLALLLDDSAESSWSLRRVEANHALAAGAAVRIENVHGTVRVRPGNESQTVFLANVQEHAGSAEARIRHETTNEGLRLWVEIEGAKTPLPQVDLALRLPNDTPLSIDTSDGLIEIKGHEGKVTARSISGEIKVAGSGTLDVTSESGRVVVVLEEISSESVSRVATTSGEIVLWLPKDPQVLVRATTRSEITTDYSIEIDQAPGTTLKKAVARIGEARAELVLSSEVAPIKILRATP